MTLRRDVRVYISIASFAAYTVAFFQLVDVAGNSVGALSFLPVIVAGWLSGLWGGLVGASAASMLNAVLFPSVSSIAAWLVPASALFAMGAFVGWVQDLRSKIQQQHEELARVARRDQLTALLNRATFKLVLERILERSGMHAVTPGTRRRSCTQRIRPCTRQSAVVPTASASSVRSSLPVSTCDEDARRMRLLLVRIGRLAEELGMQTLTQGVESEAQDAAARSIGSDLSRGTWIAPPIPAEMLTTRLRERGTLTRQQLSA